MNTEFLIVIVIPLGVYLIILLYNTRTFNPTELPVPAAPETTNDEETVALTETRTAEEHASLCAPAPISQADEPPQDLIAEQDLTTELAETAPAPAERALELTAESSQTETETARLEPIAPPAENANTAPALLEHTTRQDEPTALDETNAEPETHSTASARQEDSATVAAIETIEPEPLLPEGPLQLPEKGSPKFAFDYRGRLWVEKKRKGFFRQLRRPQLPPDEPQS